MSTAAASEPQPVTIDQEDTLHAEVYKQRKRAVAIYRERVGEWQGRKVTANEARAWLSKLDLLARTKAI